MSDDRCRLPGLELAIALLSLALVIGLMFTYGRSTPRDVHCTGGSRPVVVHGAVRGCTR